MDWDHQECPRCRYENARCACPKNVPHISSFTETARRKLAEAVLKAIKERDSA